MTYQRPLLTWATALLLGTASLGGHAADFDWNSIGWSNGTIAPQSFLNVDGSGVDVTVEVVGDTGQLTNSTPALFNVSSNNELRIFPNFANTAQSVTVVFTFSQAVAIDNLSVKDFDASGYSDAIRAEGWQSSGLDIAPNDIVIGSNVVQSSSKVFEAAAASSLDYDDPAGWATFGFDGRAMIERLEITHFSGSLAPGNPSGQAVTLSDFQFFTSLPITVSKTADTAGPVDVGDTVEYTVTVTNNRNDTLSDMQLVDTISSLASYVAGSTTVNAFADGQQTVASDGPISSFNSGSGWSTPWQATGPNASGLISAAPGSGLQMLIPVGNYASWPVVQRVVAADLSGASAIELQFDLSTSGTNGSDFMALRASTNGGASWSTVRWFNGFTSGTQTIDLSAYASANLAIQFLSLGVEGGPTPNESFNVDNLTISGPATGPITLDNGGGPNPLASGIPASLVSPADAIVLSPLQSGTATYSITVDSVADVEIDNLAAFSAAQLPGAREASVSIPTVSAASCNGSVSYIRPVRNNNDDGWWDGGDPKFDDDKYEMGEQGSTPERTVGVRFRRISIPAEATNISAQLSFVSDSDINDNTSSVNIRAVDSDDAPPFTGSIPGGTTSANVNHTWGNWNEDVRYSVDVSTIVQALVTDYSGLNRAAVAFLLEATGDEKREAIDYEEDGSSEAAWLTISYDCDPAVDSSDAPASYGQATHDVPASPAIYLGSVPPDAETSDLASSDADGDDLDNIDDEEGVTFSSPAGTNQSIIASVNVTNTSGGNVRLCGWLDRPDSGTQGVFESSEGQCQNTAGGTVQLTWSNLPSDQQYITFARFRVTSDTPMGTGAATGARDDGEVEDYLVEFNFNTPTLVTIGKVRLSPADVGEFLGAIVNAGDINALRRLNARWQTGQSPQAPANEQLDALRQYLDPDGDGQVAIMTWDTLEERGTIGFYVERRTDQGPWQRINDQLLPGLINAPMGGEYQLADPSAQRGITYQYQLIELEARGSEKTYGPYSLELR